MNSQPGRLEGLSAIVTGSSSGIGRSIALAFAKAGARRIICTDLVSGSPPRQPAEQGAEDSQLATHDLINKRYGADRAVFVLCDVSVEKVSILEGQSTEVAVGLADVVERATQAGERLDIMVNCAGVGVLGFPTHETSLEDWDKNMSVNAKGTFLGTKHALLRFLKQQQDTNGFRGAIINIASIGATHGIRGCAAYCASKAAVLGLTRSVALDYASEGIRCNALCPGYIRTPMLQGPLDNEPGLSDYIKTWVPMKALGEPHDVAEAATWLASGRESRYVTGVALPIDGGFTTWDLEEHLTWIGGGFEGLCTDSVFLQNDALNALLVLPETRGIFPSRTFEHGHPCVIREAH